MGLRVKGSCPYPAFIPPTSRSHPADNVTITHNTTNNNVQGGIVGNGTVTVHQHFDHTQPFASPPDAQLVDPVKLIPVKETSNLDELLEYAEKLMGKALAENTVRNILERADVESCGEEKRGRARPKLYPREQAEKAIADVTVHSYFTNRHDTVHTNPT